MPDDPLEQVPDPLSAEDAPSSAEILGGKEEAEEEPFAVTQDAWEAMQTELKETKERAETAEKRQYDTNAYARDRQQAAMIADENFKRLQYMRNEENRIAQQAMAMQPPQIDWEKAQEDPASLAQAFETERAFNQSQLYAYAQPAWQQLQATAAELETLRGTGVEVVMQRVQKEWEQSGYDPESFSKIEDEMRAELLREPAALRSAQQPGNARVLALWFADRKGLPLQSPDSPQPPVTTGGAPPSGTVPRIDPQVNALAAKVAKAFPDVGKLSPEEIQKAQEENWR